MFPGETETSISFIVSFNAIRRSSTRYLQLLSSLSPAANPFSELASLLSISRWTNLKLLNSTWNFGTLQSWNFGPFEASFLIEVDKLISKKVLRFLYEGVASLEVLIKVASRLFYTAWTRVLRGIHYERRSIVLFGDPDKLERFEEIIGLINIDLLLGIYNDLTYWDRRIVSSIPVLIIIPKTVYINYGHFSKKSPKQTLNSSCTWQI